MIINSHSLFFFFMRSSGLQLFVTAESATHICNYSGCYLEKAKN